MVKVSEIGKDEAVVQRPHHEKLVEKYYPSLLHTTFLGAYTHVFTLLSLFGSGAKLWKTDGERKPSTL